jgi:hypothetical protein
VKTLHVLDSASASVLGFDWLTDAVAPVSPYGERRFAEQRPFFAGEELAAQSRAQEIAQLATAMPEEQIEATRVALRALPDAASTIARASMGDVLTDPAFLELRRLCATIERIDNVLTHERADLLLSNDAVRAVSEALAVGQHDPDQFYLADGFDPELARVRARLAQAQAEFDSSRGR